MKANFLKVLSVCVVSALMLAGCGDSEKSGKSSLKADIEGSYAPMFGLTRKPIVSSRDLDDALEENEEEVENLSFDVMKFDDREFEYRNIRNVPNQHTYYGKYTVDDGDINFKHSEWKTMNNGEEIIVSIKDEPDDDDRRAKAVIQKMKELNETGYALAYNSMPAACGNDKLNDKSVLPLFIQGDYHYTTEHGVQLKTDKNCDILFVDTYGFELDGRYKYGKDFTVEFNLLDPLVKDKTSRIHDNDGEIHEDSFNSWRNSIYTNFKIENNGDDKDLDTIIEFSDGKWKWYDKDGGLINNGEYQESKKFKGLIDMYITDDSHNYHEAAASDHLFYISEDGNIYYPSYFKMK